MSLKVISLTTSLLDLLLFIDLFFICWTPVSPLQNSQSLLKQIFSQTHVYDVGKEYFS